MLLNTPVLSASSAPSDDVSSKVAVDPFFEVLPAGLQKTILQMGITRPTPIQRESFTPAREGRDVLAQSRTGSGKTLAFAIPGALRLGTHVQGAPRMLVLTPTRELADQVAGVFKTLLASLGLTSLSITGGASYTTQLSALRRGVDVVVGTPGRIVDLLSGGKLDLSGIQMFVLDEVDQMLEFGFAEELDTIRAALPASKQTLFFSATFNGRVMAVASQMLKDPVRIRIEDIATENSTGQIEHSYIEIAPGKNLAALINLLMFHKPLQALVFCQTKQECTDVHHALVTRGIQAGILNGDMKQADRTAAMSAFKDHRLKILVATDVAARGIDVTDLSHVINFSVPDKMENYTHRCGRTGRAGASGKAWTLVTPGNARYYNEILRRARVTAGSVAIPSLEEIAQRALEDMHVQLEGSPASALVATFQRQLDTYVEAIGDDEACKKVLKTLLAQHVLKSVKAGYKREDILPSARPAARSMPDRPRFPYAGTGTGSGTGAGTGSSASAGGAKPPFHAKKSPSAPYADKKKPQTGRGGQDWKKSAAPSSSDALGRKKSRAPSSWFA